MTRMMDLVPGLDSATVRLLKDFRSSCHLHAGVQRGWSRKGPSVPRGEPKLAFATCAAGLRSVRRPPHPR
jgi:hypothetical protein